MLEFTRPSGHKCKINDDFTNTTLYLQVWTRAEFRRCVCLNLADWTADSNDSIWAARLIPTLPQDLQNLPW